MSALEKQEIPLPAPRSAFNSTESQKAVIRYSDGRVVRAYVTDQSAMTLPAGPTEPVVLLDGAGERLSVHASELKAIFLVKAFEGDPNYLEFKSFPERPAGPGLWVRVHFQDGESLEGVAPNSLETFLTTFFYMSPPDPRSNNRAVLVSKLALAEMKVLGFETA